MIRIVIIEDSNVVANLLKIIIEQQPDMQVIGHAANGRDGVRMVAELRPDLVTMDIRMPEMDGFEATREIMHNHPVPIVVVSSAVNDLELRTTFRAIEEGALWVIEKPPAIDAPGFEKIRRDLIDTLRAMATVPVMRKRHRDSAFCTRPAAPAGRIRAYEIVVVGTSTGGPKALADLLHTLPGHFPLPIVVVQHISPGFVSGLAVWLQEQTRLRVKLAENNEALLPGTVYIAPDGQHLEVHRAAARLQARFRAGHKDSVFCPAINPLFESTAHSCGHNAIGLLMTGMGCDGATGLLALRRSGSHTLAQDPADCSVSSMPQAALGLEAVDEVARIDELGQKLVSLTTPGTLGAAK